MTAKLARIVKAGLAAAVIVRAQLCFGQVESPVELDWVAPTNCPQQGDVQQQLLTLLGDSSSANAMTPLHVNGAIDPIGERYRLTLRIERSANHGTRMIESEDCKSLGKAAAVIVGLLVQKERLLGRELSNDELSGQPAAPAAPIPQPPPPRPNPPAPVVPPAPQPPPRRWHILLRAPEAKVDAFFLPRVSTGLGLGVGISVDSWRVLVSGTVFESQEHRTAGLQDFTTRYRHRALQLAGCGGIGSGALEMVPCAVVSGNTIAATASGSGLVPSDQNTVVFSVGGGISGYLHLLRHVALVASGSAHLFVNRPEFVVNALTSSEEAHKVPAGTLQASLGCEWIF